MLERRRRPSAQTEDRITTATTVQCRFLPEDVEIEVEVGTTTLDAAQANDVPVETVCAGKGTCGTCRVLIRDVEVPLPNVHDRRRLSEQQLANGWRLACQHPVIEGAVYTHPVGVRAVRVVESAGLGRIRLDPNVQKIYVKPREATLHDQRADWSRIQDELAAVAGDVDPTLEALRRLAAIGEQIMNGVTVVIAGNRVVSVEAGDTSAQSYGFAFDIGTTTVVGALMDMTSGQEAAVASDLNGQYIFGGDVISRMSVTMRGPEYVTRLHNAVMKTVREIIRRCLDSSGVAAGQVYELTFVGNTVMEHLLLGMDPSRISYSPFVPTIVDAVSLTASDLDLPVLPSASVWVAPNVAWQSTWAPTGRSCFRRTVSCSPPPRRPDRPSRAQRSIKACGRRRAPSSVYASRPMGLRWRSSTAKSRSAFAARAWLTRWPSWCAWAPYCPMAGCSPNQSLPSACRGWPTAWPLTRPAAHFCSPATGLELTTR
jgi:ferredoxin